jgi:hypothetical protein
MLSLVRCLITAPSGSSGGSVEHEDRFRSGGAAHERTKRDNTASFNPKGWLLFLEHQP